MRRMKLKLNSSTVALPALLYACLFSATNLRAQAAVYGTFTATRMGSLQSSPLAISAANGGTRPTIDVSGGTFGGYYDFKPAGPVLLGFDARGVVSSSSRGAGATQVGAGSHLYSVLGGVRGVFHTRYQILKPYVQASAGLGRSDFGLLRNTSGSYMLQNGVEYHGFAGVDLKLFPLLDFRVAEVGYGGLAALGTNSHNYTLRSVTTGIVLHLPVAP